MIAEAAAIGAGATRIWCHSEILHMKWKARFKHFDWIEAAIAVDRDNAIIAVGIAASAPTARHEIITGKIFIIFWMIAAKDEIAARTAFGGHGAFWLALR